MYKRAQQKPRISQWRLVPRIHPNLKKSYLINLNKNIFFQKELLYKEVLYTIRNKVGGGQSNQFLILKDELYSYAKEAFQYTDETHARLMELATEEKVISIYFLASSYPKMST